MSGQWGRRRRLRRLEHDIASVWAEVLGRDTVGPQERFMELGGTSIAAMKIISRVEELVETELSVRALLETQTVAAMTVYVDRLLTEERAW